MGLYVWAFPWRIASGKKFPGQSVKEKISQTNFLDGFPRRMSVREKFPGQFLGQKESGKWVREIRSRTGSIFSIKTFLVKSQQTVPKIKFPGFFPSGKFVQEIRSGIFFLHWLFLHWCNSSGKCSNAQTHCAMGWDEMAMLYWTKVKLSYED